jgi:hypothetical protein
MRFAGIAEEKLAGKLYLNLNNGRPDVAPRPPRLVAKHNGASVDQLARLQDAQPFNIFGVTRIESKSHASGGN